MITFRSFFWVVVLASAWLSEIAGQNAGIKEEPKQELPVDKICRQDTPCTRLALMGVCGEKFKEKMDQKCPDYCEKCGSNRTNLSEKGKDLPEIVADNVELMDKEMLDVFNETATSYKEEIFREALNAEKNQFMVDPIFMTTEISLTGDKSDIAIDNMDLRQRKVINNPLDTKAKQYQASITQSSAVKNYLDSYSKTTNAKNKAWMEEQMAQVKRDKIVGTGFKLYIAFGTAAAAAIAFIPVFGTAVSAAAMLALGASEAIFSATCHLKTEEEVKFEYINKQLDQIKNMTIEIAVKNEQQLNAIRNGIAELYKFTWAGFNILKAKIDGAYNDLSRNIGSSTLTILRVEYFSEYKKRVEGYATLYREYIDSGKTVDTTERLKNFCGNGGPMVSWLKTLTLEKNEDAMLELVKYTKGDINKLKNFLREIYLDVDFLTVVGPVCLSLQNFDSNTACERNHYIAKYALKMKNLIIETLNSYYTSESTQKEIANSITQAIESQAVDRNTSTIQNAVDNVMEKLSKMFPSIAFFVYASDTDKQETDVWASKEDQGFYVSINRENAQWHVFWHSVEEEPAGTIWERCYNGNLSDPGIGIWFVNRPRCVRVKLAVPKIIKECSEEYCEVQSGEKIPSCTSVTENRVPCFQAPYADGVLDPTDLLNSISKHIPKNDGTRKRQKTTDLFSSKTLGLRTEAELKNLTLGYCLTAVISQTSQNIDDFSFSTTMTGAAYPWTYFMDGERLKVHNAKYSEQIVKNIQKYQDKNDEVKEKIKEDCKEDLTKSHCIFNLHSMYLEDAIQQLNNTLITFFPSDSYIQSTLIPSGKFVPLAVLGDTVQLQRELNNSEYIWQDKKRTNIYYRDGHFEIPNILTAKMTKQLLIFKKCHEARPKLETPKSDMPSNCREKLEKDLKLSKDFQKQLSRFMDKVKDKQKREQRVKILGIVLGTLAGLFLIVGTLLIVLGLVRRKRRRSAKAIGGASALQKRSKKQHYDDSQSTQNTPSGSTQLATTNQSMTESTVGRGKKSKHAYSKKSKTTAGTAAAKRTVAGSGKGNSSRYSKHAGKTKIRKFDVKSAIKKQ